MRIDRQCCALAECCGILMYCSIFSPELIKISTASPDFASRLPRLFKKAFDVDFDSVPPAGAAGKRNFIITSRASLSSIFDAFGIDTSMLVSLHVNFALIEDDCCKIAFSRGAFLVGGSVTDPEKSYHLELSTSHMSVARETCSLLQELGFQPRESSRAGNTLLYFKQSDTIADFLTSIGASVTAMGVMTARVDKEMRNTVTRQINCDSANADKTVAAAQEQLEAIRRYSSRYGLDSLPEPLKDAALLRITNPEASLSDLARLSIQPVTKSCLSHRLKKIISLAPEENE